MTASDATAAQDKAAVARHATRFPRNFCRHDRCDDLPARRTIACFTLLACGTFEPADAAAAVDSLCRRLPIVHACASACTSAS